MRNFIRAGAIGMASLTVLGGCAGAPGSKALTEDRANRLVTTVLENVEEFYFKETDSTQLVTAGLERIEETYPEIDFARQGTFFVVSVNERVAFQFEEGPSKGAGDYWGERVAAALAEAEGALSGEAAVNLTTLSDAFIEGVVDSLNEFSRYASPAEAREYRMRRDGNSGSLGIEVDRDDSGKFQVKYIYSVDLLESGILRHGDTILSIDSTDIQPLTAPEVMELLRGEVGSAVELSVLRAGAAEPLTLTVQRKKSEANSVAGRVEGNILRIIMVQFNVPGQKVLRSLVLKESRDPGTMGVILDLRRNPGGLLSAVVESADDFLASGRIVTIHGRHNDSHQYYNAKLSPTGKRPMVVLVDEHSAAGAEILAATLQENGVALVVGSTTYGNGTIQTVMPLPNRGQLILTWGEVYTAGGYRLDKRGVMPAVCTGGDVTVESLLASLRSGRGIIGAATRTRDIDPDDAGAVEAFRALCPPRSDGADIDLEVARALLEEPDLFSRVLQRGHKQEEAAAQ